MTEPLKDAQDVFRLVAGGIWSADQFMEWYHKVRTKEYSRGYSEAADYSYRTGHGGEF